MNSNKEEGKKLQHELRRYCQRNGIQVEDVSVTVEGVGVGYDPKRDNGGRRTDEQTRGR